MTYYKSLTKKVLFTVLSVALLTLFSQSVQADPVLYGYWTFDTDTVDSGKAVESSGYNDSGKNHDATLNGGTNISFNSIVGQPGNHLDSGNYIQFTNDSYAVVNNSAGSCYDFYGASFTISAWVKGLPNGDWEPYISKYGENNYGYQLRRLSNTNNPTFTVRRTGGDDDPTVNISGVDANVNDGEWHNLIAVYGGTYRELYMDGNLISRINDSSENPGGTGESLVFSARDAAGTMTAFANIALDNIAIYSGALRDNQISYINNGGDPTKLAAVQAETVSISMSEKASGKLVKTSFVGKTSHSWLEGETSFEGGYLTTNLPTGSAGLNGSFTASAWVKLDSTSGDQPIFGNQSAPGNNSALHLIVRNGEPHMGFYGNDTTASGTKLSTDEWYYLTFQYDADNKTQKIYLNGKEIASNTNKSAFAGNNFLEIGAIYSSSTSKTTLDGSLKGVSVTDGVLTADQITAMMNATTTTRVEDFSTGKNTAEWCGGCGATFGNAYNDYNGKSCLMTYWKPYDGTTSNIYGDGDSDNKTGAIWGPQFTVADSLPDDAKISFSYAGSSTKLKDTGHVSGGVGVALWDIDEGDFVRDSSGNILSYTGNNSATWFDGSFSLKGLEGHNLMLTMVDRQTGSYGWIAITDVTADTTQISSLSSAAQHSLVLNSYNFDTEGSFDGMYEIDSAGNKLDEITHFTNGSRQGSAVTNFYIDQSGSFSAGKKGFLSSGTAKYGEEQTTGILRSDNFLVQGDVLEFYIAGGNNINNKHIDLVDADTGEIYFSATGDNSNDFHYDMWNLKDIQGKSVYIKIVDADGGTSWSHLEIDQIQQTKFAPTEAMMNATSNNKAQAEEIEFNTSLPGFNAKSYSLDTTPKVALGPQVMSASGRITTLDELADYIANGAQPTGSYYRFALGDYGGFTAGAGQGVEIQTTLNVTSSGQYTFALVNDEACRLMLNDEKIFETTEGSDMMQFFPFTLTQSGQYALDMLYLDETGKGVSLYIAEGAFDSWNDSFKLLSGSGIHLNAYGDYFIGSNFVPEPSTWALMILGFAGLMWLRSKK